MRESIFRGNLAIRRSKMRCFRLRILEEWFFVQAHNFSWEKGLQWINSTQKLKDES
jgi:hypothetical protein